MLEKARSFHVCVFEEKTSVVRSKSLREAEGRVGTYGMKPRGLPYFKRI